MPLVFRTPGILRRLWGGPPGLRGSSRTRSSHAVSAISEGQQAGVDAGRRALQKPTRQPVGSAKCGAEAPRGINPALQDLGFLLLVTAPAVPAGVPPHKALAFGAAQRRLRPL